MTWPSIILLPYRFWRLGPRPCPVVTVKEERGKMVPTRRTGHDAIAIDIASSLVHPTLANKENYYKNGLGEGRDFRSSVRKAPKPVPLYHSYNSQIQYSMLRISPERNCLSPLSAVQSTQKLNRWALPYKVTVDSTKSEKFNCYNMVNLEFNVISRTAQI